MDKAEDIKEGGDQEEVDEDEVGEDDKDEAEEDITGTKNKGTTTTTYHKTYWNHSLQNKEQ